MLKRKFKTFLIVPFLLSAFTSSVEIYDSSKHNKEDFDLVNTVLIGIGAAAVIDAAAAGPNNTNINTHTARQ